MLSQPKNQVVSLTKIFSSSLPKIEIEQALIEKYVLKILASSLPTKVKMEAAQQVYLEISSSSLLMEVKMKHLLTSLLQPQLMWHQHIHWINHRFWQWYHLICYLKQHSPWNLSYRYLRVIRYFHCFSNGDERFEWKTSHHYITSHEVNSKLSVRNSPIWDIRL